MSIKDTVKKIVPTRRKLIQLYFALLYNANLKGFGSGNIYKGNSKNICVPGLNCYSCPGAVGACPLGSLQGAFSSDKSTMFYMGGILVLFGVLFGRLICGWACPFGLLQELFFKVKTPKLKKSVVTRLFSALKYAILVLFVVVIPIIYALRDVPLPAFCKYICPAGTFEGGIGLLSNKVNEGYFSMLGPIFTWKFALLISFVVGCIFVFRLFCRFFCPLGALYGLFNRFSVFGIRLERDKCIDCGACINKCKMDVRHVGDMECISCGECIGTCPTKAISWKGSSFILRPNDIVATRSDTEEKETAVLNGKKRLAVRCVTSVLMIAILAGAFLYYWREADDTSQVGDSSQVGDLIYGNEVGDMCYGDELECFDKNGLTGGMFDPTKTGKITVINFWGTWCTPCVNELPYFDRIADEYTELVTVVAVHTSMAFAPAPEYVGKYYASTPMVFVKDHTVENTEAYYASLGGRGTYPYTVILDETGRITKIFLSSVTYEELKRSIDELLV